MFLLSTADPVQAWRTVGLGLWRSWGRGYWPEYEGALASPSGISGFGG